MKKLLLILAIILPRSLKLFCYRKVLGWKIGDGVKIGFSYIESNEVIIGENVQIRHFNIIRRLERFQVGNGCYIANFNQFFGNNIVNDRWTRELILGEKVLWMSHHFVDVAGTITIGNHTTVAGRDSHFWTHSLTYPGGVPELVPMNICVGEGAYIGARATLLGCSLPDRAVVGAGSVVNKNFAPESCRLLIAGNPATIKKRYENKNVSDGSENSTDSPQKS